MEFQSCLYSSKIFPISQSTEANWQSWHLACCKLNSVWLRFSVWLLTLIWFTALLYFTFSFFFVSNNMVILSFFLSLTVYWRHFWNSPLSFSSYLSLICSFLVSYAGFSSTLSIVVIFDSHANIVKILCSLSSIF